MNHPLPPPIFTSSRLILRSFKLDDAGFLLELLNEPAYIKNIRDRGLRSKAQVHEHIAQDILPYHLEHGFGYWCVTLLDGTPIGMSGLLKRDFLPALDVGYALLSRYAGLGYASEAAQRVCRHAREDLGQRHLLGMVNPDNQASKGVLQKCGMRYSAPFRYPGEDSDIELWERVEPASSNP